jgi:hypothetical protein
VVSALPDLATDPEFDVVFTEPDCPPLPESPEVATGLEVALPVSVEPVEPVFPEVAAALPQLPLTVMQGATVTAEPEFPELPEFPESPDWAVPVEVASPVFPELASPDEASVLLPLVEVASPEVPPVVVPLAVESPLLPEVPVAVELSEASPVLPEVAVPWAGGAGGADPWGGPDPFQPEPPWLPCGGFCPLTGWLLAGPELPDPFHEALPAPAGPVAPVLPDSVLPVVSALPDWAADPEFDVVFTEPDLPPLPESPEVATGLDVALPVSVEPVDPVSPDVAFRFPGADGWCFLSPCPQLLPPQLFPPWYTGVAYWAPPGVA